jgi:hypothetical protein
MNSFSELQRFKQVWVWILVLVSSGIPAGIVIFHLIRKDSDLVVDAGVWTSVAIAPALLIILFRAIKLETTIDATGVSFRLFPFQLRRQQKSWDEIDRVFVRQYSPLKEYGGWGMRYTFRKGTAYNISGDMGLQLVLKNNKKILIGTVKPDEANAVLKALVGERVIDKAKNMPTII